MKYLFCDFIMACSYRLFRIKWLFKNRRWENGPKKNKAFHAASAKWYEQWYRKQYGNEVTKLWR